MTFATSVASLDRVGKALKGRLARLGIETVHDLLMYFPFRYEDYSRTTPIAGLADGLQTTVRGKIVVIAAKRTPRKRTLITEAIIADGDDELRVVWFGQPYIAKTLKSGDLVHLSGKVSQDMFGLVMKSPAYEKVKETGESTHTARIVPIYSLTAGMTQKQVRYLMDQCIHLTDELEDWIPEEILDTADLISYAGAVRSIHFPESAEELEVALKRLKFDELFLLQLRGEQLRQQIQQWQAPRIPFFQKEIKDFVGALPFELTKDQKVTAWKILQDMEDERPMNRLVEGDVGSGKTVVAGLVAYNTVLAGYQVAVMAPTEILAKQHFASFVQMLPQQTIALMTGSDVDTHGFELSETAKTKRKKETKQLLAAGEIDIAIGTHALLTDDTNFHQLGLAIVDEQHRFGVDQRKKIRLQSGDDKTMPHFLSMTATPIPRSFALTLYGDLDLSVIKEMPKGRKPVKTRLVDPHHRAKAYQFIAAQVKAGRQVFVICPMIEIKDDAVQVSGSEKKSVMAEYDRLQKEIFPTLRIGYVHGKMKPQEKDAVMQDFANKKIDILVSTSVVEVGVNIPNASVMMIEGADHFGLAQLHQFRGRVGRSSHQSYCFLFTDSDAEQVRKRLDFFQKHTDGFAVSEYDLEMRGPGEVYGSSQSGMMNLKLATLQDGALIQLARTCARDIDFGAHPTLLARLKAWEASVHLE